MNGEKILVVGATGQVALPSGPVAGQRERGLGHRPLQRPGGPGIARGRRRAVRGRRPGRPRTVGTASGFHLRAEFGHRQVGQVDRGPRRLGRIGGLFDGALPQRQGLPALLVDRRVRAGVRHAVFAEDHPLGDNHRIWASSMPVMQTYSIGKIAAEAVARFGARRWNLPTTIARLAVPTGTTGGGRPPTSR